MCPNGLAAGPRSLQGPHTSLHLHLYWKRIRSDLKHHRFCNGKGSRGSSNPTPYFVDKICKILFEHGKKKATSRHIFMAFYKADWSLVLFVRRGRKELWQEGRGMAVRKQSWPRGRGAHPTALPGLRCQSLSSSTLRPSTRTANIYQRLHQISAGWVEHWALHCAHKYSILFICTSTLTKEFVLSY